MKPEQLVNLLMCRGDLSRADARQVPDNGGGNKCPTRMGGGGSTHVPYRGGRGKYIEWGGEIPTQDEGRGQVFNK